MSVLTYKNIQDEVLANLDESGDTGTTLTLVKYYINHAHELRLGQYPWPFMRWATPETLTMVSGQRLYALHSEYGRGLYFWNRTTKLFMSEISERGLENQSLDWTSDTSNRYFRFSEIWPVAAQPSSASVITISSSAAGDTTSSKALTIKGISSGVVTSESITPNGLTPVAGSTSFTKILGITKGAAWTGTATLTSNAAAVTNLTLLPSEFARQYQTIEFLSLPNSGDVIEYSFIRKPTSMSADNDIPDIPFPYSRILVWDALGLMAGYLTDVGKYSPGIWASQRAELETQMLQTFQPGQTLGAQPDFVRVIPEDAWGYY